MQIVPYATSSLIKPKGIAVIGGSNDASKPGVKLVTNLLGGSFSGDIYVVNPNEHKVPCLVCIKAVADLPPVDLAILAIPVKY